MEIKLEEIKKQHAKRVAEHLIKECETDTLLKDKILHSDKTIGGCVDYLFKKAKEKAEDGCAWVDDDTVWEWSREFYLNDSIKEEKAKPIEAPHKVEEKPKAEDKPVKEESKPKVVKEVKKKLDQQLSLFDLGL